MSGLATEVQTLDRRMSAHPALGKTPRRPFEAHEIALGAIQEMVEAQRRGQSGMGNAPLELWEAADGLGEQMLRQLSLHVVVLGTEAHPFGAAKRAKMDQEASNTGQEGDATKDFTPITQVASGGGPGGIRKLKSHADAQQATMNHVRSGMSPQVGMADDPVLFSQGDPGPTPSRIGRIHIQGAAETSCSVVRKAAVDSSNGLKQRLAALRPRCRKCDRSSIPRAPKVAWLKTNATAPLLHGRLMRSSPLE